MTTTDEIKQPLLNHIAVPPDRARVRFLDADRSEALNSQPSTLNSSPKVTCLILTYNEEARIRTALTHALQWADEVVVVDKGSTDATCQIALDMFAEVSRLNARGGAPGQSENLGQTPGFEHKPTGRVGGIPFSSQGHERYEDMVAWARHDWVWHFTPGEVPTKACIETAKHLLGDDVDLILVPMHYFSFGEHHPHSPWAGGWQPRLYHRRRVTFTGIAHDPIRPFRGMNSPGRVCRMDGPASCYVLHQTHATAESFIRSHTDYAINEAQKDTPERVLAQAFYQMQAHQHVFSSNPRLAGQHIGWQLYWLQVALHAWGKLHPTIPADYAARAKDMLALHWSTGELRTDAGLAAASNGTPS